MSGREKFPLIWWIKKKLPHRHGQRCTRYNGYDQYYKDREDKRRYLGEDVECFMFDDGTIEWGPKRGARRPDRDWKDELEHKTPECSGQWHHVSAGYVCSKCEQWVRRTDETRPVFDRATTMDWTIHYNVKAAAWCDFFGLTNEGPRAAGVLLGLVPSLAFDKSFCLAMEDLGYTLTGPFGYVVGKQP